MSIHKIALVTGGGSGLGFAIAQKFVDNGITTIITGRDVQKLNAAKKQLGENCYALPCDLNNLSGIPSFVNTVLKQFGQIDILVNNAGINMKKDFTEVTDDEFLQVLTTNVLAVFALSREVVRHMLQKKEGSIIHISSMAAHYGLPRVIAYSASKTAIEGMTRAMAVELSPNGIRVNCIAPGFIYSDMTDKAFNNDPQRKERVFNRTPMGIMGQPEDVGNAALYLAGDAAKFVTGIVLPVDGGNSIGF